MLSEKMLHALNEQIKWELQSSYLYLGMAAWLSDAKFDGVAKWMRVQAKEEVEHAMKFYSYIEERGNRVVLEAIPAPEKEWTGVCEVMEKSLAHEQFVTSLIHKLVDLAAEEKDHATSVFLQWFVKEQVEEEATFRDLVDKLGFMKPTCATAWLSFNKHMAKRGEE